MYYCVFSWKGALPTSTGNCTPYQKLITAEQIYLCIQGKMSTVIHRIGRHPSTNELKALAFLFNSENLILKVIC